MKKPRDWSLFPTPKRSGDTIRMILHGGAFKGDEGFVISNPEPVAERGPFPGFVIEVQASDLENVDTSYLPRIEQVWIHDHNRAVRRLPDILWELPNLRSLSLTDSRLNAQLFRRGTPRSVEELDITGSGRFAPRGPSNPNILYLNTIVREFHPRISRKMFPNLSGLTVHVGRKSDRKDRREMWDVICSFEDLNALHVEPADSELRWSELPSGLRRIKLGNGDLEDLSLLHVLGELEYLHLHFLRSSKSLDGIESLSKLRALVLIGMDGITDYSALLRMPGLEYVHVLRSKCPEICTVLEERGVVVQG